MRTNRKPTQQLPTRWLVAIVAVLLVYGLSQPVLNSRLGWSLPSLAGLLDAARGVDSGVGDGGAEAGRGVEATEDASDMRGGPNNNDAGSVDDGAAADGELLYGLLKSEADDEQVFVSPTGLRYEPGSQEGHRLKHLERHLQDQPTRPGKHGVFSAEMPQVLLWIDDAFARAQTRQRGVRKRVEGKRVIYEVPFTEVLGYVGGRDGKRDDHPACKRMRLIVDDGDVFITAFPI